MVLDAIASGETCRKELFRLCAMMLLSLSGKVEINLLAGKITGTHYRLTGRALDEIVMKGGR